MYYISTTKLDQNWNANAIWNLCSAFKLSQPNEYYARLYLGPQNIRNCLWHFLILLKNTKLSYTFRFRLEKNVLNHHRDRVTLPIIYNFEKWIKITIWYKYYIIIMWLVNISRGLLCFYLINIHSIVVYYVDQRMTRKNCWINVNSLKSHKLTNSFAHIL